ncbi:PREDICTED: flavonoid 3'-monooxygenase-like [Erythranthe guttata]|uniref:flavonoid 3'-monooxygenase-like n=1 Tax=Erythranthe guttata TaxID=4155 RepID=UPI00064D7B1C|nr:PREDICTED: flavonoid 3'-monooxygenase-like [Erythranthe guttata]|eukprot:XP_012851892.1 PREDICTED: flavonoid 3'-monooxygenase-like [Erythranthe guttata]
MRKIFVREIMSTASLEAFNNLRRDVVRKAVRHIGAGAGKPVKIGQLTFRIELDVILNMLWSCETLGAEQGDTIAEEFFSVVTKLINLLGRPNIYDYIPVLARFDIQGVKKRMESYRKSSHRIFDVVIAEHKKKTSSGEIKKDFLQILLALQKNEDSRISINDTQIKAIMMDMGGYTIPRSPSKSSTVGGYTIPRKTMVYIIVRSIQRDPSIWDSPLEFKPERFLHDDENSKCDFRGNRFHYLPFGTGRRICAGIPFA